MSGDDKIGFFGLLSLSVGGILGVSIFILPVTTFRYGNVAWLFLPLVLCLSRVFSDLSMMYPNAGGPYGYVRQIVGNSSGRIAGYTYLVAMIIQQAAVLAMFGETCMSTFKPFTPICDSGAYPILLCVIPTILCGLVHSVRFKTATSLSMVLNMVKFAPIALLLLVNTKAIFSLLYTSVTGAPGYLCTLSNFKYDEISSNLSITLPILLFAFSGLEFGTIARTEEVHNPEKNIPRAVFWATALSALVYFLMQCMIAANYDCIDCKTEPGSAIYAVAEKTLGHTASTLIALSRLVFGWAAVAFGIVFIGHMISQMSSHGNLPKILSRSKNSYALCMTLSTLLPISILLLLTGGNYQGIEHYTPFIESCDILFALMFLVCTAAYCTLTGFTLVSCGAIGGSLSFLYASFNTHSATIAAYTCIICGLIAIATHIIERQSMR
jgi:APA family basic amino acid/polyamine antiporter